MTSAKLRRKIMPKLPDFNDNINETLIAPDQQIISTGGTINGWTVGAARCSSGLKL
jgi:hypothetical protein